MSLYAARSVLIRFFIMVFNPSMVIVGDAMTENGISSPSTRHQSSWGVLGISVSETLCVMPVVRVECVVCVGWGATPAGGPRG